MKIVIIGDGKVGHKLCAQLSEEDYDIVLIDQNAGKLKEALNRMDIFCITGQTWRYRRKRTFLTQIWLSPAHPQTSSIC